MFKHARALQVLIALAIAVAYGPEIFAAMEMTVILELLGASLFLTAFAAGARLLLTDLSRKLYDLLIAAAQMAVIRSDAPTGQKALACVYVAGQVVWCVLFAVILFFYCQLVLGY
jgi:hypothetical protein